MTADAVLFDLDGTLVEYERPATEILEMAFERTDVDPFFAVDDYYERYETFFEESDSIEHLRELVFADIAESRGIDPDVGVRVAKAYAEERDHSEVFLLPGAEAFLDALEGRPLGLVTNGDPEMQRPKLAATGLDTRFDTIVYAGHDTRPKPHPEPFQLALERLRSPPETATFVGNDPKADVEGAHDAGLSTVWLRNGADETPETPPQYTIDSFNELLDTPLIG